MLVTFSSKVDANVLMMAEHARQVLRAAGKDIPDAVPERGVFAADQLSDAIARLEKAIGAEKRPPEDDDEPDSARRAKEIVVLGQRAYPLLAMMRKAHAAQAPIMWETSSGW